MRITRIHINAMVAVGVLAGLATMFIVYGEFCAAAGLGGVIGMVATSFANAGNGD